MYRNLLRDCPGPDKGKLGHKPRTVSERKTVYSFWRDSKSLVLLGKEQAKLGINQNMNSRTLVSDPKPAQGKENGGRQK